MVIHYGEENEYDDEGFCPLCDGTNIISERDYLDNHILLECKTTCIKCGHENYWAHGHFTERIEEEDRIPVKVYKEYEGF